MKKKRILVNTTTPGMVVAEDVRDSDNQLVVSKDTKLTAKDIADLKSASIFAIKIAVQGEDDADEPAQETPAPAESADQTAAADSSQDAALNGSTPTYFDRLQASTEFAYFQDAFNGSVESLIDSLNDVVNKNAPVQVENMLTEIKAILSQARTPLHMLNMLQCMRSSNDLTYVHSINVCLISNAIGTWMNLPENELNVLTIAGLLHDIGKLQIPEEIITKPGKLTEEEFSLIHFHPKFGFDIVKTKHLDPRVGLATLQHHERIDGSGYPAGLKGNDIELFSKIIAIADVYDAMTANRIYREGLCPFKVMAAFEKERHLYDPGVLYLFLERTVQAYANMDVLMSNGIKGKLVLVNRDIPSKPIVIGEDGKTYDLKKIPDLEIQAIL